MNEVVLAPADDYLVRVGALAPIWDNWLPARAYTRIMVICDKNTRRACWPVFEEAIGTHSADLFYVEIPAGESFKTLDTCRAVWTQMLDNQLDRYALIVNLGGGVVGDLGGFCAATYKRGIDFVQVPTTLLAATDAAIGGKLGVDFEGIKNTLGVFRNPVQVLVDPVFLKTLAPRELRSGMAEVIKHAAIGDQVLWNQLAQMQPDGLDANWYELLAASIAVKVHVVQTDPYEKNLRMLLNFGHTIGHAVESYFLETEHPLTHGEAIAVGMVAEARLAVMRDQKFQRIYDAVKGLVSRYFEPLEISPVIYDALWAYMRQDKKNLGDAVRMAVPYGFDYSYDLLPIKRDDLPLAMQA
jgi:3-dehydroquinate synthase